MPKGKSRPTKNLTEAKMVEWDESQGQMLGRAMRKLGDRRFRVFCNDNKIRICRLAGSMRKSDWVDEGAIILIGIRGLSAGTTTDIGDILEIIDSRIYGKLKKQDGINPLLFTHVENQEEGALKKKILVQESGDDIEEDIFEHEDADQEEREQRVKAREQEIAVKRSEKLASLEEEVDIDAI